MIAAVSVFRIVARILACQSHYHDANQTVRTVHWLFVVGVALFLSGLAFVVAGARWGQPDGQVVFLFILAIAAAEVSVGLALVLELYHQYKSLDTDAISRMKG